MRKVSNVFFSFLFSLLLLLGITPVKIAAEHEIGLYVSGYNPEGFNEDYLTDNLTISYGYSNPFQFYFYDGENWELISDPSLLSFPEEVFATPRNIGLESTPVIALNCSNIFDNKLIEYTVSNTTYSISISCILPRIALYSGNPGTINNMINNVIDDNADSVYLLLTDNQDTIESVSFAGYYNEGATLVGNESVTFDPSTGKLTFTNILFGDSGIILDYKLSGSQIIDKFFIDSRYDLGKYIYKGIEYSFGLAQKNDDNNLNIVNNYTRDINNYDDMVWEQYLVVGNTQGATAQVAPEVLYNGISNVEYSLLNNTFGAENINVIIGDTRDTAYERLAFPVTVTVKKGAVGKATVMLSFDLTIDNITKRIITFVSYAVESKTDVNINLSPDDMNLSNEINFNTIFASYDDMISTYSDSINGIVDATKIFITLPEGKYSGEYIFNAGKEKVEYYLRGTGDSLMTNVPYLMKKNDTEITGSFQIKSGHFIIEDIDFVGSDSYKNDVDGKNSTKIIADQSKIGVFACNPNIANFLLTPSATNIYRCSFKNYDYAVVSTDSGVICDINECTFDSCQHGYYMDEKGEHTNYGGSGSRNNLFLNCDNAISIISTPNQLPVYSLRFVRNYFIQDGTKNDFNLAQDNQGAYLFRENYFGSLKDPSYPIDINNLELRTVKINKNGKDSILIATNPCIRYLGSQYELGVDPTPGLLLRIFNGVSTVINSQDIANVNNVDILSPDGRSVLGSLNNGGNKQ